MKHSKLQDLVEAGEKEFKVKKGVNDGDFEDGEIIVLTHNSSSNNIFFFRSKNIGKSQFHVMYAYELKRLKKNKKKDKKGSNK